MKYFPYFFAFASAIAVSAVPVTFKVDLSVKTAEGQFFPTSDTVDVRGSFNGWSPSSELTDTNGDKIYEGTVEVGDDLVGKSVEYKFVITKASDGSANWETINNRSFTPAATGQTLDPVFFSNDSVVSRNIKAEIAFAVDMSVQTASGNFNKATDEVYVRGNKMGWGAPPEGVKLIEDAARPGIYTNLFSTNALLTGEPVEYKFTIWKPETSFTGWEEGANKVLTFDGTEPDTDNDTFLEKTAPTVYFNGLGPADALSTDTAVTFSVDMSNAKRTDGTEFAPGFEGVWVNGNFANWWAWGSSPVEYQMVDDGTNGDETADDLIYSLTLTLPRGTSRMLDYKYAIDSLDNEAGFADNHIRYIRADGTFELPIDVFGVMTKETPSGEPADIGSVAISKAANGNVTLTWTGAPSVRLRKTDSLVTPTWTDVPNSTAVSTITLPASGTAGFFRLYRP